MSLTLKELIPEDAARLCRLTNESAEAIAHITKFGDRFDKDYCTPQIAEAIIRNPIGMRRHRVYLGIWVWEGCEEVLAGEIFASPCGGAKIAIGYWLGKVFCGKGLMTDAVKLVVTKAFTFYDVSRVFAEIRPGNVASQAVLLRAGFRMNRSDAVCVQYVRDRCAPPA